VEARGNTLLRYWARGRVETLAVFPGQLVDNPFFPKEGPPQIEAKAVLTAVAKSPDKAYCWVSELSGFPFPVAGPRIWRVMLAGRSRRYTWRATSTSWSSR
jgi:hypothetical protein